jgi:hypothetical protein
MKDERGAGRGVDPDAGENRDPITGEPHSHPAATAVGAASGAAGCAAMGGAVGGPIGSVIGGSIGAVVGAASGHAAGEVLDPREESHYWSVAHRSRPYYEEGIDYGDYEPAYRYGWESAARPEFHGRRFEEAEDDLARGWVAARGNCRRDWDFARHPARDAWERIRARPGGVTGP